MKCTLSPSSAVASGQRPVRKISTSFNIVFKEEDKQNVMLTYVNNKRNSHKIFFCSLLVIYISTKGTQKGEEKRYFIIRMMCKYSNFVAENMINDSSWYVVHSFLYAFILYFIQCCTLTRF